MGQPKHTVHIGGVKVTQGPEGDGWFDVATITVEPALRVGPAFVQAVLGRNPAGVKLDEILSDYERNCTVFLGQIALTGGDEQRDGGIHCLVARIQQLADNPLSAPDMMTESPFQNTSDGS